MKTEIILVSMTLRSNGFEVKSTKFDAVEKGKTYQIEKASNFGGKTTNIKKADIMVGYSVMRDDVWNFIARKIWCLPHQEKEAIEMLKDYAKTESNKRWLAAKQMNRHFKTI
jgi:hypothetical protein